MMFSTLHVSGINDILLKLSKKTNYIIIVSFIWKLVLWSLSCVEFIKNMFGNFWALTDTQIEISDKSFSRFQFEYQEVHLSISRWSKLFADIKIQFYTSMRLCLPILRFLSHRKMKLCENNMCSLSVKCVSLRKIWFLKKSQKYLSNSMSLYCILRRNENVKFGMVEFVDT